MKKLAVVANYGDACGIATYTGYLVKALTPRVGEIRVFAEDIEGAESEISEPCWSRGQSLLLLARRIREWGADAVLIQHEYGIFPRAGYWLQFLQHIDDIPYAVTMHSVYEHFDKAVCSAAIKNVIVHSQAGEACLRRLGHTGEITVIPHGCVSYGDVTENWCIYHTPYAIMQFGFGFRYKGVEVALEAIRRLKEQDPAKYAEIFYTYLCSDSQHVSTIIGDYFADLTNTVREMGLEDNVAILRGFQSEQTLCHYLRTNRLAIFPYVPNPDSIVYGASGAIRVAMANATPVIASASPMFSDLDGVLPRPANAGELAEEIDRVFSDRSYRDGIVQRAGDYVAANSWENVAGLYVEALEKITACRASRGRGVVRVGF